MTSASDHFPSDTKGPRQRSSLGTGGAQKLSPSSLRRGGNRGCCAHAAGRKVVGSAKRDWWIGVLFAIGSTCFLVGPFPGLVELVGSEIDGVVFFVGSIFFTSAATLQYVEGGLFRPRRLDWWSNAIQLAGTLFFNVSTFDALRRGLDANEYDRLVWTPDARGSVCFLVSGCLAMLAVARRAARGTGGSPS